MSDRSEDTSQWPASADDYETTYTSPSGIHSEPLSPFVVLADIRAPNKTYDRIVRVNRVYLRPEFIGIPVFNDIFPGEFISDFINEAEWHHILGTVNSQLRVMFDPLSLGNVIEGTINLMTCWIFDKLIARIAGNKSKSMDQLIKSLNDSVLSGRNIKLESPTKSAFMTLDFYLSTTITEKSTNPSSPEN
ncbi:Golgin subfamily A member 7/ERF4 family-domain-containing protein [Dipodascopsis uninucleata]